MIFITGTDTDCGKTTVGRALAAAFRRRGLAVAVFKPCETGCVEDEEGRLIGADALALSRAAGSTLDHERLCPVRLRLPASPERAAEAEGRPPLTLEELTAPWRSVRASADVVIAEGAGGLLVPIAPELMMADLPRALDLPVVVVARDALGTVNHALLTLEAIRSRGLDLLGVIFSSTGAEGGSLENVAAVGAHGAAPVFGVLPYLPGASDEALGEAAEAHLDLEGLLGKLSR